MKRILIIAIWVIIFTTILTLLLLHYQDIKERELEHRANATEARRAYIQKVTDLWKYDTGRTVGSWWVVEAQQDVNKFNEVIKILGGQQ